jgi:amino acid transporter
MATTTASRSQGTGRSKDLHRSIGFWGLLFISLGSIIGSGWLLGALDAATVAGPASLISWILAVLLLMTLALVHAELSTAYPVAGGTARFPYFAFGGLAGFTAGWAAYLQAVTIAPIEVEAALSYLNSTDWAQKHLNMLNSNDTLNGLGLLIATGAMLLFTVINLYGAKLLSESNAAVVIWKAAVPILAIIVIMSVTFHASNFSSGAGGFAPYGVHGIFAALPAGVVFALQGFEQAVQMGGEAKNPQRHMSRAIISAMFIGAAIYILLEITFIGSLNPADIAHGWTSPLGKGNTDLGAYYTIALGAGVGWLATILLIDAVISPSGTGLLYLGTSARLSYAIGEDEAMPTKLTDTNRRGVPVWSVLLAFVLGELVFLPFPSWASLVGLVTEATAIMYAFAPVSFAALRKCDGDRERPYKCPIPAFMAPASFCGANLIIYWSGFEANWKIFVAILLGAVGYAIALTVRKQWNRPDIALRSWMWVPVWMFGMWLIGLLGRYGGHNVLPDTPWDLIVVVAFSLAIFYWAERLPMDVDHVHQAVKADARQLEKDKDLNVPG